MKKINEITKKEFEEIIEKDFNGKKVQIIINDEMVKSSYEFKNFDMIVCDDEESETKIYIFHDEGLDEIYIKEFLVKEIRINKNEIAITVADEKSETNISLILIK